MVSITIDNTLSLRTYVPEDADALFNVIERSRAHLHPWLPWVDGTQKPEHSLEFIQASLHQMRMQEGLTLCLLYNDEIIGGVGMHDWRQAVKKAQIGYWIVKEQEGKGIMSKALTALLTYLFDKAGLNKIEIRFVPENKRSAKIAEKLGAKIEGVIRQSILRNGQPADVVVAGILKSEWKALSAQ